MVQGRAAGHTVEGGSINIVSGSAASAASPINVAVCALLSEIPGTTLSVSVEIVSRFATGACITLFIAHRTVGICSISATYTRTNHPETIAATGARDRIHTFTAVIRYTTRKYS